MDTTESSLEERIVHLERRNRRMQNGMFFLGLLALIPWTFAAKEQQRPAGVVRATELQLVVGDSVYSRIKPVPTGIAVFSAGNVKGAELTQDSDGGLLRIFGGDGRAAVGVGSISGNGFINVRSGDSAAVSIGVRSSGGGSIRVFNPLGKIVAALFAKTDSSGEVNVRNPTGTWLGGIAGSSGGGATLAVNDARGKTIVTAYPLKAGGGGVAVSDAEGVQVGWFYKGDFGGRLDLSDLKRRPNARFEAGERGGSLSIINPETNQYVGDLSVREDGGGQLSVLNTDGTAAAALAGTRSNSGWLRLYDRNEKSALEAGTASDDPSGYVRFYSDGRLAGSIFSMGGRGEVVLRNALTNTSVVELYGGQTSGRLQMYTHDGTLVYSVPDR